MDIKTALASQYRAALAMLGKAVRKCPDALWDDRRYVNVFWHVAYHALFYTHFYLQDSPDAFTPWAKHETDRRYLGREPGETPYSKDEILEYLSICREQVKERMVALNLEAESGFSWLPYTKLEVQIYNIRHLQQHVGELYERLGAHGECELQWIGSRAE